jgi:two-component system OmpR family response regulator
VNLCVLRVSVVAFKVASVMRLLVVEDEPDLLAVLAKALREEGYAVDEAADGEAGLYKATAWDYDAVVLDVMLPKLDGWGVVRKLRMAKATPVLMLTAKDAVPDRVKGLDAGADDYLIKPFDLSELLARVRALVRRGAGKATAEFTAGDVRVDTRTRTVSRGGAEVPLTAREYAILEYLALRRGELVTKADLYDHIFDETDDTASNLIEVHVSHLRKKLGADVIQTRRGMGYVFDG